MKLLLKRILLGVLILAVVLPLSFLIRENLGLNLDPISVSGTGSMYPTFPKGTGKTTEELSKQIVGSPGMLPYPNGIEILGKRYLNTEIGYGDIVVFENARTRTITKKLSGRETGWAKRVVGLSGDTLELRGGIVYRNDKPLREAYTAKPRSTFGESFLSECQKIKVPLNSAFVMGDNRKGSGDSREIGFIPLSDIDHVLPLDKQKGLYDKYWRKTKQDLSEAAKIRVDKNQYLELLNKERLKAGVAPLKYEPLLEQTAALRGQIILENNDFSFEATKSGFTMKRAMDQVGYWNVVYGEAPQLGYYEANELIENQFQFPETKNFLLNNDYDEIGISEVEGNLNQCPSQVVVIHFAGYLPPNYETAEIESWQNVVNSLNTVIPTWETALGMEGINQENLKVLLAMLNRERLIADKVLAKMKANEWLTKAQETEIEEFDRLSKESASLSQKLNSR